MNNRHPPRFLLPKNKPPCRPAEDEPIITEETTPVKRSPLHTALRAGRFGVNSPLAAFEAHQESIVKAREERTIQRFKPPPTKPVGRQKSSVPANAGSRRFIPVAQGSNKRSADMMNNDEPDADEEEAYWSSQMPADSTHNPFDVSEELEEPTVRTESDPERIKGHRRFLTRPTSTGSPAPAGRAEATTSNTRRTSAFLATIHLDATRPATDGHTLASDWSPHKKRTTKFLPGGMAETVALWIYQAQVSND